MYDDQYEPSRQRGRSSHQRDWDHDDRCDDGQHASRQGYSRSPIGQNHYRDSRGRDPTQRDSQYAEDDYSQRGDGYARQRGYSKSAEEGEYADMYDDGQYERTQNHRDGRGGHDRREHSRYRDRDEPRGRSRSHYRHSRSRSRSPHRDAGQPSDTVILEELPLGVTLNELKENIFRLSEAANIPSADVRLQTSRGHRRAFVQFGNVEEAAAFVKDHYPRVALMLSQSTDDVPDGTFTAYLHYARGRDDSDARAPKSENWSCPECNYSNFSTRDRCKICGYAELDTDWRQTLTGSADASEVPSQLLVVYPLPPFVTEDMFAGDMKKLEKEKPDNSRDLTSGAPKLKSTAPTGDTTGLGARPGSLHRVFIIRDTQNDESLRYGFVEFWTLEDANAAMVKFRTARSFTVAACAVTVSPIHLGVFLPEEREITSTNERYSFNPLFNPALRVKYRDHHVYPSQYVITTEPPEGVKTQGDETSEDKKSKKRKAIGSSGAPPTKKAVPMAGQMALWNKKHDEIHDKPSGGAHEDHDAGSTATANGTKANGGAPIKISLGSSKIGIAGPPASSAGTSVVASSPEKVPTPAPDSSDSVPVSYVDRDRLMCLICMMKYKSVDEVNKHEKSRNHRNATEKEDLVKAALPRLAIRDKRQQKQSKDSTTPDLTSAELASSQYRDRAKERRTAYSQPGKPANEGQTRPGTIGTRHAATKPAAPATVAAAAQAPAVTKGAGMLAKMGWTSGAGLGAQGEGRTEVIETNAYQEGVGLGADGGNLGDAAKLAESRTTNSYAAYVNSVQDKARQRYNGMN